MSTPYTKEQIAQANSISLIDYAKSHGYNLENSGTKSLHAKHSGGLYFFKDTNKFYHWSTGKAGGIIDFVMEYEGKTFLETIEHLLGEKPNITTFDKPIQYKKEEKEELILPKKSSNYKRIYWYLCSVRGIEPKIVSYLMKEKKIYQQAERGNCVFVGYDENKIPKYCSLRGTNTEKPFKMDKDNSDKSYPFSMEGTSNKLYVLESPIDVMSHATLFNLYNLDYHKDHRISLGCLSDSALSRYLTLHPQITHIVFALDNDIDGKSPDGSPCNHGQVAVLKYCQKYKDKGYTVAMQKPNNKDFNEDLIKLKNQISENHINENNINEKEQNSECEMEL